MLEHKFEVGQKVWAKSGKRYTVMQIRLTRNPEIKDEPRYYVRGERDGVPFGPWRVMRESSFRDDT
jgi:hypothetical protein